MHPVVVSLLLESIEKRVDEPVGRSLDPTLCAEIKRADHADRERVKIYVCRTEARHRAEELTPLLALAKGLGEVSPRLLGPELFAQSGAAGKLGEERADTDSLRWAGESRWRRGGVETEILVF